MDGRSHGPIGIAWGVCVLALVPISTSWIAPGAADGVTWLTTLVALIGLVVALGVLLVAGWRDRAGGARWGWLLLASALGIQIWATVLAAIPMTLMPLHPSLLSLAAITIAGIVSVVGPARIWADQTISVSSTIQRLLEAGMIGLVAGMAVGYGQGDTFVVGFVAPAITLHLAIDGIALSGLASLFLAGRRLGGFISSALLTDLIAAGILVRGGSAGSAGVLALDILRWGILALAAAYRASPAPQRPAGDGLFDRDDCWRGTSFARLTLMSGLASAAFWSLASFPVVIGFVVIAVTYEGWLQLRHAELQRQRRACIRRERAAVHEAREHDQQLIQALARLIHDLGPPVQGVSSIADLLLRIAARETRESPRTLSERLGHHADQLEHLIRQLNARLRRQSPPSLRRCGIDVTVIATLVVESFQPMARRRTIDLSLSLGTEATEVMGDAHAVQRILDNLVSNALAATPAAGVIVIELWIDRAQPDDLTISVRDSGPGLTADEQQRVFLPRSQLSAGPGLGLGLSIVAELTAHLGGALAGAPGPQAGADCRPARDHPGDGLEPLEARTGEAGRR
ncbi:MAG: HAMP domain-containing sensor histidine kinase [Chloroflexales bacterium]